MVNLEKIKEVVRKSKTVLFDHDLDGYVVKTDGQTFNIPWTNSDFIKDLKTCEVDEYESDLIFGKDKTRNIVSLEVYDDEVLLYKVDGSLEKRPMIYWILAPIAYDKDFKRLEGDQHYKYIKTYDDRIEFVKAANFYKKRDVDIFRIWNEKEAAMIYYGITMFKGLKVKDVSVLSFDIESSGLVRDDTSKVFFITNTFRNSNGNVIKRHFRVDHYKDDDVEMIRDWCKWVVEQDPTIITGHNIFGFDLDYLRHCCKKQNYELELGKDNNVATFSRFSSSFRVDGTTAWDYFKVQIPGRHIVDTMFLSVKYDIGRSFPSWGLKPIIDHLGLVKDGRQFYDASKIKNDWYDLKKREDIVSYGIGDSDDSLALYDLMIPSIFYFTQSVPKPFQIMAQSATGAQLNTLMIRSYLQDNHSIPKASERTHVGGGISFGPTGILKNVLKIDIISMYPSIIRSKKLFSKEKDPNKNYLKMVDYFTEERFKNKRLYKETGDEYYNDLQASQKIAINSSYGLTGTSGLNYNDFSVANEITSTGRQILIDSLLWATSKNIGELFPDYSNEFDSTEPLITKGVYNFLPGPTDTDSISFYKQDYSHFSEEEQTKLIEEINSFMPKGIEYEHDGYFNTIIVLKAKNYILQQGDKVKMKGSSLRDMKKEPALKEFIDELIKDLLATSGANCVDIYHKYIREAINIQDITRWCTKKSVTKPVLKPTRTNEQKIRDAIGDKIVQEGDKVYLYSAIDGMKQDSKKGELVFLKSGEPKMIENRVLKLKEDWQDDEDQVHYVTRVYKTLEIFKNVIDTGDFLKYHLKSNHKLLENL